MTQEKGQTLSQFAISLRGAWLECSFDRMDPHEWLQTILAHGCRSTRQKDKLRELRGMPWQRILTANATAAGQQNIWRKIAHYPKISNATSARNWDIKAVYVNQNSQPHNRQTRTNGNSPEGSRTSNQAGQYAK